MVKQAVELYNNHRLYFSLEFQTPSKVHLLENVKYKSYKSKKMANLEPTKYPKNVSTISG